MKINLSSHVVMDLSISVPARTFASFSIVAMFVIVVMETSLFGGYWGLRSLPCLGCIIEHPCEHEDYMEVCRCLYWFKKTIFVHKQSISEPLCISLLESDGGTMETRVIHSLLLLWSAMLACKQSLRSMGWVHVEKKNTTPSQLKGGFHKVDHPLSIFPFECAAKVNVATISLNVDPTGRLLSGAEAPTLHMIWI